MLKWYEWSDEELGRHRDKNDDRQCKLCRDKCENAVHVLWGECPVSLEWEN